LYENEKLVGARVYVGSVDAARLEESSSQADAKVGCERVSLDGLIQ
jgi:hypothetical protein